MAQLGVLALLLVVPGRAAPGARLEWAALGMVPRVLTGLVALGAVALTVLLARLAHTSVAAGVQPKKDNKGQEGHHSQSSQGRRPEHVQILLFSQHKPSCCGHQWAVTQDQLGVWQMDKGRRGCQGVGYQVRLPKHGWPLSMQQCVQCLQLQVDHPTQWLHEGAGCSPRWGYDWIPRGGIPC